MRPSQSLLLAGIGGDTALQVLTAAGLTTNLKLCLDTGDPNSGQGNSAWLDVSGNAYNFNRGTGGNPTFTGAVGSRGSYWLMDTAKEFTYNTTNESWMQTIHKDGAIYSIVSLFHSGGSTAADIAGTSGGNGGGHIGFVHTFTTVAGLVVSNSGGSAFIKVSTLTINANAWNMVGLSVNENGGSVSFFFINGTADTAFDANYTSPSSSNATFTMQVAAGGNNFSPFDSNTRMNCFLMWQGTALTSANMTTIWNGLRGRFGI